MVEELKAALKATGLVEPVEDSSTSRSVSVLTRLVPGSEPAWLRVVEGLLSRFGYPVGGDLIIARRYLIKNGRMVFGWFIRIEAKSSKHLRELLSLTLSELSTKQKVTATSPAKLDFSDDPDVAAARAEMKAKGIKILPRAVDRSDVGPPPEVPKGTKFEMKTVENRVSDSGQRFVVQEFPLPHVYKESNKPAHPNGRGAKKIGG